MFNPRNIYDQLSQLMFKLCSDQCGQSSGISLMLMLPCRPPQNSLSQKQSRMCRWDTSIKGSWRRQKYRRRSQATCFIAGWCNNTISPGFLRYICDVRFGERLNKVWCTIFLNEIYEYVPLRSSFF